MLLITVDFISLTMVVAAGHVASRGDLGAMQFKDTSGREEGLCKVFIAGQSGDIWMFYHVSREK